MRRRHESDVDRARRGLPHTPYRAGLQRAQELGLHGHRQLADLVEEDRSTVGRFDVAHPGRDRAGEGSLGVTEQLALDEVLRDRAAVDHDEGPLAPWRGVVDGPRDELLARARLAVDEDRRLGARHPIDHREEHPHGTTAAEQRAVAILGPRVARVRCAGILDVDHGGPEANTPSSRHARTRDAHPLDEGPVLAPEVADPDAVLAELELGVHPRHRGILHHDGGLGGRTRDGAITEREHVGATEVVPGDLRRPTTRRRRLDRERLGGGRVVAITILRHRLMVARLTRASRGAYHAPRMEVGEVFQGRYRIDAMLGEGGMGRVFRAYDATLRRFVALKVLRPDLGVDATRGSVASDAQARLLREARAVAALAHPNIVALYDIGQVAGVWYIVMELVEGSSLRGFIGDKRVSMVERLRWLALIARALGAAHDRGIIHRDIKPDNVMVCGDRTVKVLDFGIAKSVDQVDSQVPTVDVPASELTRDGHIVGTPRFMSPEQVAGGPIDSRSDQFSWALVAYELLSGVSTWSTVERTPDQSVLEVIRTREPRRLREVAPAVSPAVEALVLRALEKKPERRFDRMEAIAATLDHEVARITGSEGAVATSQAPSMIAAPSSRGDATVPLGAAASTQPTAPPVHHASDPSGATLTSASPDRTNPPLRTRQHRVPLRAAGALPSRYRRSWFWSLRCRWSRCSSRGRRRRHPRRLRPRR